MPKSLSNLTIIHYPDPRLRRACEPVPAVTDDVRALAARMLELMHAARGVGLAAPQVGRTERLFVSNTIGETDRGSDRVFINPTLSELAGIVENVEGCLSIPDVEVTMRRAKTLVIDALDLDGRPVRLAVDGLAARCYQHELDHLDGRLIIDRMSETDQIANRRLLRQLEQDFHAGRPVSRR